MSFPSDTSVVSFLTAVTPGTSGFPEALPLMELWIILSLLREPAFGQQHEVCTANWWDTEPPIHHLSLEPFTWVCAAGQ